MPAVYLKRLDTLWFQVAGTHCNLQCSHCFISCGPKNNNHAADDPSGNCGAFRSVPGNNQSGNEKA